MDRKVKADIFLSLENHLHVHVSHASITAKAWQLLCNVFKQTSFTKLYFEEEKLMELSNGVGPIHTELLGLCAHPRMQLQVTRAGFSASSKSGCFFRVQHCHPCFGRYSWWFLFLAGFLSTSSRGIEDQGTSKETNYIQIHLGIPTSKVTSWMFMECERQEVLWLDQVVCM